jgi:hypothetical protein
MHFSFVEEPPIERLNFAIREGRVFLDFDLVLQLQVPQLPLSPQVQLFVVVFEHGVGAIAVEAGDQLGEACSYAEK